MELKPVDSDHLAAVGYDEESYALQVQFNDESIYEYDDVPPSVYEGLMSTGSKSSYFRMNIKGRYKFYKVA